MRHHFPSNSRSRSKRNPKRCRRTYDPDQQRRRRAWKEHPRRNRERRPLHIRRQHARPLLDSQRIHPLHGRRKPRHDSNSRLFRSLHNSPQHDRLRRLQSRRISLPRRPNRRTKNPLSSPQSPHHRHKPRVHQDTPLRRL